LDILGLVVSSAGHDLGHPGYNNNYHINSGSELAIKYNDISCLENFHTSTLFRILRKDENNIFENMDVNDYKHIRKRIVNQILATDMVNHAMVLSSVKAKISSLELDNNTKENIVSVPTTDLVTLQFESTDESVQVFYGYVSKGLLYYFNDEKASDNVNEGAFDFITAFDGSEISEYKKLNNIKRIKSFNRGSGVSTEIFLITDNGKVYSTRNIFAKNIDFQLTEEFKNYDIEDILKKTGEAEETFEVLLKDGRKINIKA
jgi:hypothetical protein